MGFKSFLLSTALLASLRGASASVFDDSAPKIATYWDGGQSLSSYCSNPNIDIFQLAFITSLQGQPQAEFGGPLDGNEVKQCQSQGKTIILSLGGETYNEGGWPSAQAAEQSAQALWQQYGPTGTTFAVDGFDFDFEVPMSNLVPFTQRLLQLRKQAGMDGRFFLTAAPQCQWPDANLGSVLNMHMDWFDAIFVQFYNNPECGIPSGYQKRAGGPSARREGIVKRAFNLATWISQAGQAVSQVGVDVGMALKEVAPSSSSSSATTGPTVAPGSGAELSSHKPKIYVGVPGSDQGTPQSHMGYVTPDALKSAVSPFLGLKNFGGVSIWDVQYATSNIGFLEQVKAFIGSP